MSSDFKEDVILRSIARDHIEHTGQKNVNYDDIQVSVIDEKFSRYYKVRATWKPSQNIIKFIGVGMDDRIFTTGKDISPSTRLYIEKPWHWEGADILAYPVKYSLDTITCQMTGYDNTAGAWIFGPVGLDYRCNRVCAHCPCNVEFKGAPVAINVK